MDSVTAIEILLAVREHLPPGIRFSPTDQEAVNYLKNERGRYRGYTVVPQIDICKWEPFHLPGQFKKMSIVPSSDLDGWFLCKNEPGQNSKRSAKGGYWKITGKAIDMKDRHSQLIATKKFLTFYKKKWGKGTDTKTNWVMHEYDLPDGNVRDLVLCHVMLKPDKALDLMDDVMDYPSFDEDLIQKSMKSLEDQDLAQATMDSLETLENHCSNSWHEVPSEAESGSTFMGHSFVETGDSSGMDFSFTSASIDQYEYDGRKQREKEGFSRTSARKMEGYRKNSVQTPNPTKPVAKRSAKMETTSPKTAASTTTTQAREESVAAPLRYNMITKKGKEMVNLNVKGVEKAPTRRMTSQTASSAYSSCSNCYEKECRCGSNPAGMDFLILFVVVLGFVITLTRIF